MKHLILFFAVVCCSIFVACEKSDEVDSNISEAPNHEIPIFNGDEIVQYVNASEITVAPESDLENFIKRGGFHLMN